MTSRDGLDGMGGPRGGAGEGPDRPRWDGLAQRLVGTAGRVHARRAVMVGLALCLGLLVGMAGARVGPFGSAGERDRTALVAGGIPGVVAAESRRLDERRDRAESAERAVRAGRSAGGPTDPGGAASRSAAGTVGSTPPRSGDKPGIPAGGDGGTRADGSAEVLAGPAGIAAVRGPALTVELDDAPPEARHGPYPRGVPSPGPNDLVVHQQDVQAVVNALWSGGAEAMSIMNRRVTARTAVRCVGNTLLLGGEVFSPPFRITAIGDVAALRAHLRDDPQVSIYRQYVDAYRLGYRITENPDARLPAATLPPAPPQPSGAGRG